MLCEVVHLLELAPYNDVRTIIGTGQNVTMVPLHHCRHKTFVCFFIKENRLKRIDYKRHTL